MISQFLFIHAISIMPSLVVIMEAIITNLVNTTVPGQDVLFLEHLSANTPINNKGLPKLLMLDLALNIHR